RLPSSLCCREDNRRPMTLLRARASARSHRSPAAGGCRMQEIVTWTKALSRKAASPRAEDGHRCPAAVRRVAREGGTTRAFQCPRYGPFRRQIKFAGGAGGDGGAHSMMTLGTVEPRKSGERQPRRRLLSSE